MWFLKLKQAMVKLGFKPNACAPCLFSKEANVSMIFVIVYVDDCYVIGSDSNLEYFICDMQTNQNLQIFPVEPNGNCMLSSLALGLTPLGHLISTKAVHAEICDHLIQNFDFYDDLEDGMVKQLSLEETECCNADKLLTEISNDGNGVAH
jgi:hypothetical protein